MGTQICIRCEINARQHESVSQSVTQFGCTTIGGTQIWLFKIRDNSIWLFNRRWNSKWLFNKRIGTLLFNKMWNSNLQDVELKFGSSTKVIFKLVLQLEFVFKLVVQQEGR